MTDKRNIGKGVTTSSMYLSGHRVSQDLKWYFRLPKEVEYNGSRQYFSLSRVTIETLADYRQKDIHSNVS